MDILDEFISRFINRSDTWSYQAIIKDKLQYLRVKPGDDNYRQLDQSLIEDHLAGRLTLSVYATDELYCSKWCCWDADEGISGLSDLETALLTLDLHPVREAAREHRDGHMWLFFDEPIPAQELIDFHNALRDALDLDHRLEFYPAADRSGNCGRFSQMRLPLGVHRKPGAANIRGWFAGADQDLEKQIEFINAQPFDQVKAIKRIAKLSARKRAEMERERLEAEHARQEARRSHTARHTYEKVDLLQVISINERVLKKGWWITRCPACEISGHDQAGDNLHINADDGTFFKCWEGHVVGGHSTLEIIKACA